MKEQTTSIVITNYNYMDFLARAIRSCILQTYPSEIIVVNDASTDESHSVINSFAGMIKPVLLSENVGLAEARNIGLSRATCEHITFLDADDCLHREFLRIAMLNFEFGEADAYASDYIIISDKDEHISRHEVKYDPLACGIVYRRDDVVSLRGYNPAVEREDVEFAERFRARFLLGYTGLPLYRYRYHGRNGTLKL